MSDACLAACRQLVLDTAAAEDWLLATALAGKPPSRGCIHSSTYKPERTVLVDGVPALEIRPPQFDTARTDSGVIVSVKIPYRWLVPPPSKDADAKDSPTLHRE